MYASECIVFYMRKICHKRNFYISKILGFETF